MSTQEKNCNFESAVLTATSLLQYFVQNNILACLSLCTNDKEFDCRTICSGNTRDIFTQLICLLHNYYKQYISTSEMSPAEFIKAIEEAFLKTFKPKDETPLVFTDNP